MRKLSFVSLTLVGAMAIATSAHGNTKQHKDTITDNSPDRDDPGVVANLPGVKSSAASTTTTAKSAGRGAVAAQSTGQSSGAAVATGGRTNANNIGMFEGNKNGDNKPTIVPPKFVARTKAVVRVQRTGAPVNGSTPPGTPVVIYSGKAPQREISTGFVSNPADGEKLLATGTMLADGKSTFAQANGNVTPRTFTVSFNKAKGGKDVALEDFDPNIEPGSYVADSAGASFGTGSQRMNQKKTAYNQYVFSEAGDLIGGAGGGGGGGAQGDNANGGVQNGGQQAKKK